MKPIEFLSTIEPVMISLFDALRAADMRAEVERGYLQTEYTHYSFEFERWSVFVEHDQEKLKYYCSKAKKANKSLLLINAAAASAAGAILQTSRQCISMAWPKKERLYKGRLIGSQTLSAVIWHARNQSLHFEEGVLTNRNTLQCIKLLEKEIGLQVDELDQTPRSLARDIIRILNWLDYESYAKDMVKLLEEP